MKLKEKKTGKLIETEGCIVNGPGFTMSMEAFAEQYETVPETEKPFEEVAKPKYTLKYSAEENCDGRPDMAGYVYVEERELHIADQDYYEILPDGTKKTKFTWDEAMEIPKKTNGKWRLPTVQEWFAICTAFGKDENGEISGKALVENLNLTIDGDCSGNFWSSDAGSTEYAHHLYFRSTSVAPQDIDSKVECFAVRCVAQ